MAAKVPFLSCSDEGMNVRVNSKLERKNNNRSDEECMHEKHQVER